MTPFDADMVRVPRHEIVVLIAVAAAQDTDWPNPDVAGLRPHLSAGTLQDLREVAKRLNDYANQT